MNPKFLLLFLWVVGTSGEVVIDGGSDDEGASMGAHGGVGLNVIGGECPDEGSAAAHMERSDNSPTVGLVPRPSHLL
jgi:hypothetical protein